MTFGVLVELEHIDPTRLVAHRVGLLGFGQIGSSQLAATRRVKSRSSSPSRPAHRSIPRMAVMMASPSADEHPLPGVAVGEGLYVVRGDGEVAVSPF